MLYSGTTVIDIKTLCCTKFFPRLENKIKRKTKARWKQGSCGKNIGLTTMRTLAQVQVTVGIRCEHELLKFILTPTTRNKPLEFGGPMHRIILFYTDGIQLNGMFSGWTIICSIELVIYE